MKRRWILPIGLLLIATLLYAGGPSYTGQVRVFMKQAGHSEAKIDSVTSLPKLPAGKYLYVSEDFLSAAVVTIHQDGSGTADKMYDMTGAKR